MTSVLGLLEAREAAARGRVEDLREAAARAAAVLEAAEIELDRRVIAREELVEALAVSAADTTAVTEPEAESVPVAVAVAVPAPLPGTTVPSWQEGLPATVLAPDYQRILGMLADRPGQEPAKAREIAVGLGLEPTPAKVEGVRSKARRLRRTAAPATVLALHAGLAPALNSQRATIWHRNEPVSTTPVAHTAPNESCH